MGRQSKEKTSESLSLKHDRSDRAAWVYVKFMDSY